jgi:hypothetical protein
MNSDNMLGTPHIFWAGSARDAGGVPAQHEADKMQKYKEPHQAIYAADTPSNQSQDGQTSAFIPCTTAAATLNAHVKSHV